MRRSSAPTRRTSFRAVVPGICVQSVVAQQVHVVPAALPRAPGRHRHDQRHGGQSPPRPPSEVHGPSHFLVRDKINVSKPGHSSSHTPGSTAVQSVAAREDRRGQGVRRALGRGAAVAVGEDEVHLAQLGQPGAVGDAHQAGRDQPP